MISCKLYGQLGNQMFQYAATIATALKYGDKYLIPNRTQNEEVWKSHHFENVNYRDISRGQILPAWQHWKEPSHSYTEIPDEYGRRLMLDGYFQSYKYFEDYLPEIKKAFGFNTIGYTTPRKSTFIHVRRGDYLKYPTKHPVVTIEYLKEAMEISASKGVTHFDCFSDDMEWVKENLNKDLFPNYTFDYYTGNGALVDLEMMTMTQNCIISNSTFSWWGAYLNANPNKIVITPDEKNWFGIENKHLSVVDLLPKEWIRIKY